MIADEAAAARIAANLAAVRARIDAAAGRAGRAPHDIRLVAVSKTFGPDAVRAARAAGQTDFGENKVQEALAKAEATRDLDVTWHLIGHLQRNKARRAGAAFPWIHSVDSLDVLERLDQGAADAGVRPTLLIQVDLAGETTKFGVAASELRTLFTRAAACAAVDVRGLMLLPPWSDDPEASRPWFRRLCDLRARLLDDGVPATHLTELSMGMSHDFEVAIEEGATIVRVGSAIFGARPTPAPAS